jgi:hypothetical protein
MQRARGQSNVACESRIETFGQLIEVLIWEACDGLMQRDRAAVTALVGLAENGDNGLVVEAPQAAAAEAGVYAIAGLRVQVDPAPAPSGSKSVDDLWTADSHELSAKGMRQPALTSLRAQRLPRCAHVPQLLQMP